MYLSAGKHMPGHAGQEPVEKAREAVRVELLGNRREAANVHEHERDRLHLAAELQAVRVAGELFDEGRGKIAPECAAYLPPLGFATKKTG
jgi:hypothetical protein